MKIRNAKFYVGQVVHHREFDYRAVVVDVDLMYSQSEEWYEKVLKTRPSKTRPWYYLLVDHSNYHTYVPEQSLELDRSGLPVAHPDLPRFFANFDQGSYVTRQLRN
jgi:heat shock protein HspQ